MVISFVFLHKKSEQNSTLKTMIIKGFTNFKKSFFSITFSINTGEKLNRIEKFFGLSSLAVLATACNPDQGMPTPPDPDVISYRISTNPTTIASIAENETNTNAGNINAVVQKLTNGTNPQNVSGVTLDYAKTGGQTDKWNVDNNGQVDIPAPGFNYEQTTSSSVEVTVMGTAPDGTPMAEIIQVSTSVENVLETETITPFGGDGMIGTNNNIPYYQIPDEGQDPLAYNHGADRRTGAQVTTEIQGSGDYSGANGHIASIYATGDGPLHPDNTQKIDFDVTSNEIIIRDADGNEVRLAPLVYGKMMRYIMDKLDISDDIGFAQRTSPLHNVWVWAIDNQAFNTAELYLAIDEAVQDYLASQ